MSNDVLPGEPIAQMLGLRDPWVVRAHQFDAERKRLDIWICQVHVQTNWLGHQRRFPVKGREQSWRHLDVGGWHSVVHVSVPEGQSVSGQPWAGEPGQMFSHAMGRFIFELLYNGVELAAICSLYGISLDALWRFKYALDSGRSGISLPDRQKRAATAATPTKAASDAVPDPSNPVWTQLATGDLNIDIKVLSLKLLLTRIRSQMAVIQDESVRELKVAELHRYFSKNARQLSHELNQIGKVPA